MENLPPRRSRSYRRRHHRVDSVLNHRVSPAEHTHVSVQTVQAIIHRHRLPTQGMLLRPWVGGGSCVYPVGDDLVLKVPHNDPAPISSIHTESIASAAAYDAGVRTPKLIVFDNSLKLLPVPYLVHERVQGESLLTLDAPPQSLQYVWREVGRNLAIVHTRIVPDDALRLLPVFNQLPATDLRPWVEDAQRFGSLSTSQGGWLVEVLDRLASTANAPRPRRFCHGDVNATNIMVSHQEPRAFISLLDWGGAGWGTPETDFSGISLRAVPFVLAGYRELAPIHDEDAAKARVLWSYLQLALFSLNRNQMAGPARVQRIERLLRDTQWFLRWAQIT